VKVRVYPAVLSQPADEQVHLRTTIREVFVDNGTGLCLDDRQILAAIADLSEQIQVDATTQHYDEDEGGNDHMSQRIDLLLQVR